MGYFRRKIDRERARAAIRGMEERHARDPAAAPRWEVVPPRPPTRRCFLRFATAELDPGSGRRKGVFTAAYELQCSDRLEPLEEDALDEPLGWLERNVPAPKWWEIDDDRAIFLFRTTVGEALGHVWDLVHQLEEHGIRCEMQVFDDPGLIVYEDEWQVAVVPSSGPSRL